MSVITRNAHIADLEQLANLFDQYRVFYKKASDIEGAKQFLIERINNKESEIFVAEEGSNLLGFVQLYPLFSSTNMKRLWLLNDLFVNEKARGKGISVLLIQEAKRLCKQTKANGLMLETAKDNFIGNNLYLRTDFELDKEHNFYFWGNE